jgi:hypothetical protein
MGATAAHRRKKKNNAILRAARSEIETRCAAELLQYIHHIITPPRSGRDRGRPAYAHGVALAAVSKQIRRHTRVKPGNDGSLERDRRLQAFSREAELCRTASLRSREIFADSIFAVCSRSSAGTETDSGPSRSRRAYQGFPQFLGACGHLHSLALISQSATAIGTGNRKCESSTVVERTTKVFLVARASRGYNLVLAHRKLH